MTKEAAINLTYKNDGFVGRANPSMVSWNRVMRAMDIYANARIAEVGNNATKIDFLLRNIDKITVEQLESLIP